MRVWTLGCLAFATAALGLAPADAAVAVPPPAPVNGYVWANQPGTADYVIAHSWAYNSTGGAISVHRAAAGDYEVRFAGMAGSGGVAHARPYGSGNTSICTISNWHASGGDQFVSVRCFNAAGAPADSRFVASFTNRGAAPGTFAYLWASQAAPAIGVPYAPSATYSYDSTGTAPQVWRQSVGVYMMVIGSVDTHYPVDHNDGAYQITAYNKDPVRCEVHGENDETPTPIGVFCFDAAGAPADTRFVVTYAHSVSIMGTAGPAANALYFPDGSLQGYWNAGGAPAFTWLGVGRYQVSFPGLALSGGHATAGARGSSAAYYCGVSSWSPGTVTVNCYDSTTDLPAEAEFGVMMVD